MNVRKHAAGELRLKKAKGYLYQATVFCSEIFSVHSEGFAFLGAKHIRSGAFKEAVIDVCEPDAAIAEFLETFPRSKYDLYFCPNAFSSERRKTKNALPTPYAQVDIDYADPSVFEPQPNFLIGTSDLRTQGLWWTKSAVDPAVAEARSRALVSIFGGDKNGWSATKYLRVPYTYNHKPQYDRPLVRLLKVRRKPLRDESMPSCQPMLHGVTSDLGNIDPTKCEPANVRKKYRRLVHPRVNVLARDKRTYAYGNDRSKVIFEIIAGFHEAGASPDEIASVLWENPYFISKHGQNQQVLEDEIFRIISKLDTKS